MISALRALFGLNPTATVLLGLLPALLSGLLAWNIADWRAAFRQLDCQRQLTAAADERAAGAARAWAQATEIARQDAEVIAADAARRARAAGQFNRLEKDHDQWVHTAPAHVRDPARGLDADGLRQWIAASVAATAGQPDTGAPGGPGSGPAPAGQRQPGGPEAEPPAKHGPLQGPGGRPEHATADAEPARTVGGGQR